MRVTKTDAFPIGDIYLPNTIIEAQKSNRLVIFAGAGVSAPDLPLRERIVKDVEEKLPNDMKKRDIETLDEYLGRVAASWGIPIEYLYFEAIDKYDCKPNPKHHDLLRLFGNPKEVVR